MIGRCYYQNVKYQITKDPIYDGYQRGLASNLCPKMNNYLKNLINPLSENLKKEKYIQDSKTIFGVLI